MCFIHTFCFLSEKLTGIIFNYFSAIEFVLVVDLLRAVLYLQGPRTYPSLLTANELLAAGTRRKSGFEPALSCASDIAAASGAFNLDAPRTGLCFWGNRQSKDVKEFRLKRYFLEKTLTGVSESGKCVAAPPVARFNVQSKALGHCLKVFVVVL
jgi:hypothetical protein